MTEVRRDYNDAQKVIPIDQYVILKDHFDFAYYNYLLGTGEKSIPVSCFLNVNEIENQIVVYFEWEQSNFTYGLAVILFQMKTNLRLTQIDRRRIGTYSGEKLSGISGLFDLPKKHKQHRENIESISIKYRSNLLSYSEGDGFNNPLDNRPRTIKITGTRVVEMFMKFIEEDSLLNDAKIEFSEAKNAPIQLHLAPSLAKGSIAKKYIKSLHSYLSAAFPDDKTQVGYTAEVCLIIAGLKEWKKIDPSDEKSRRQLAKRFGSSLKESNLPEKGASK